MQLKIPESLKHEHKELHLELKNAIKAGGKPGDVAKKENKMKYADFAERFMLHAKNEEEV